MEYEGDWGEVQVSDPELKLVAEVLD